MQATPKWVMCPSLMNKICALSGVLQTQPSGEIDTHLQRTASIRHKARCQRSMTNRAGDVSRRLCVLQERTFALHTVARYAKIIP